MSMQAVESIKPATKVPRRREVLKVGIVHATSYFAIEFETWNTGLDSFRKRENAGEGLRCST